nr:hypothetical protein [Tanacetum cinerariifolium]
MFSAAFEAEYPSRPQSFWPLRVCEPSGLDTLTMRPAAACFTS